MENVVANLQKNTRRFMQKLILGCGYRPEADAINLDMFPLKGVNVVHDLNTYPYPFENDTFTEVTAIDVLEHVDDLVKCMNEIYRIMKVGGEIFIRVPDARYPEQLWIDPTHRRGFVPKSFDNWDPATKDGRLYGYYFAPATFKVIEEREFNKGMEYKLKKI